jgi:hypothetical protein
MRRNKDGSVVGFQKHLEKVARVDTQNRPAVGSDIPDVRKLGLKLLCCFKVWQDNEVMDFPRFAALRVDRANLAC